MKKALIILTNLAGGGAEKVILDIVNYVNENSKWTLDIFLLKNQSDYLNIGQHNLNCKIFYSLEANDKLSLKTFKVLKDIKKVAKNYPLIIGGLELVPTYYSYIISKLLRKKHVGWVHIALSQYLTHQSMLKKLLFKTIYPNIQYLVFPSKGAQIDYQHLIKKEKQFLNVIPNPINREKIIQKSKEKIHLPYKYIISVGRLDYQKGFDVLIKAYDLMIKNNPNVRHKLVILGKGKEENNLKKLVKDLNLENKIIFLGFQKNPYPYIKNSDFFVLSSRFEGFGVVLVEALALGKAVISTNCLSGPAEILENGKYGILVPTEDIESLSYEMHKLIINNSLKNKFEHLSIHRAEFYDIKKISSKWENFLDKVASK